MRTPPRKSFGWWEKTRTYPKTVTLLASDPAPTLFGLALQNVNCAYQVFPAILAATALYFVEKYITKITRKPIRAFFVLMVCFIVVFPLTLLVLGPIGLTFGKGLTTVMLTLYKYVGRPAVKAFVAMRPGLAGMAMFVDPYNAKKNYVGLCRVWDCSGLFLCRNSAPVQG